MIRLGQKIDKGIIDVVRGEAYCYQDCVGDTWDPAWAGDDCLITNTHSSFSRLRRFFNLALLCKLPVFV